MRAATEHHIEEDHIPILNVMIVKGQEDLSIKVSAESLEFLPLCAFAVECCQCVFSVEHCHYVCFFSVECWHYVLVVFF